MALIDPNNPFIGKSIPPEVWISSNLRPWKRQALNSPFNTSTPKPAGTDIELSAWINAAITEDILHTGSVYEVADITARNNIVSYKADVAVITDADGSGNRGISFYTGSAWTTPVTEGAGGGGGSNIYQILSISNTTGDTSTLNTTTPSLILLTASSSNTTLDLPASPTTGEAYTVKAENITNTCSINGNGNNIDGDSSYEFSLPDETITIVYSGSEWKVI